MPTLEMQPSDHVVGYDPTEHLRDEFPTFLATPGLRIPPRGSSSGTGLQHATRMVSDYNLAGIAEASPVPEATQTIPVLDAPWELRMRSNGAGWYYFNTVTGDVKTDRALMQQQQQSGGSGMTRTVSEPHRLSVRQPVVITHNDVSPRSATPTTSRRPSTAGSTQGSTSRATRGVLDMAEDALRVFGIKNKNLRRTSKVSLRTPTGYQTKHANVSFGGSHADETGGKRSSAGSIPTRSSSRMSAATGPAQNQVSQSLPMAYPHEQPRQVEHPSGLFWTDREDDADGSSVEDHHARRRVERDHTKVQEYVRGIQRQLDDAVHAAEQHLLALQTPDQLLTSLSLSDTPPSQHNDTDIPVSQRPTAQALRTSVSALVPLVRQLVYATRHALIGLDQVILETLPTSHTDWQAQQSLAYLSPEQLHHPQRRLVAALSKIIFFTHSAAGTDWPLSGTAERLALDTRDLGPAVRTYVEEVARVGCLDPARGRGLKSIPVAVFAGTEREAEVRRRRTVGSASRQWRALDDSSVRDLLGLIAAVERSAEAPVTLESGQSLVGQVDDVFHSLRNLDVLASVDVDEDDQDVVELAAGQAYVGTMTEARDRVADYSAAVRRVQDVAGQLLLHLIDQNDGSLTETVHDLDSALKTLSTSLSSLLAVAKKQAELVPPHLAGRLGAQSSAKAEKQEKLQSMRQSSSTRSSLASVTSLRDRPGTRYYPAGSLDFTTGLPTSRSQTSLPGHSISRTGSITAGSRISASSSLTSLSQTDDYNYNYSRNSVSAYGKSGTFEERSKSTCSSANISRAHFVVPDCREVHIDQQEETGKNARRG